MNSNFTIRVEEPRDFRTVENLTRDSFWNVYHPGCTEHYVLRCFRSNPDFKRQGYGLKLLNYALEKAKTMGIGFICMEGNINFYRHAGFDLASK